LHFPCRGRWLSRKNSIFRTQIKFKKILIPPLLNTIHKILIGIEKKIYIECLYHKIPNILWYSNIIIIKISFLLSPRFSLEANFLISFFIIAVHYFCYMICVKYFFFFSTNGFLSKMFLLIQPYGTIVYRVSNTTRWYGQ